MPKKKVSDDSDQPPLLTVRAALILLLALLAGGLVAWLMSVAGHSPAEAALGGLGALAAVVTGGNRMIG